MYLLLAVVVAWFTEAKFKRQLRRLNPISRRETFPANAGVIVLNFLEVIYFELLTRSDGLTDLHRKRLPGLVELILC